MAQNGDIQIGFPARLFGDTEAEIEAISHDLLIGGEKAYALDTGREGLYNGLTTTWEWGGGGVEPVNPSVVGNLVSFADTAGAQADSGIAAGDATMLRGSIINPIFVPLNGDLIRYSSDDGWTPDPTTYAQYFTDLLDAPDNTLIGHGLKHIRVNAAENLLEFVDQDAVDAALLASADAYADSLVVGLWDDRGSFDASVNAYPSSGGSGAAGAILKGDAWTISVAGTLPTGQIVEIGDLVRALIDTPGNTQANWAITQNNIGYVAENAANKSTSIVTDQGSDIKFPSVKSVYDWAVATFQAIGSYLTSANIVETITNGVTDKAPSENAVFDALATKISYSSINGNNSFLVGSVADGMWVAKTKAETKTALGNASTSEAGFALQATAPAAGLLNVVGIENGETAYSMKSVPPDFVPRTAFTPVLAGASTAGAGTYNSQLGEYSRVGNMVMFTVYLNWSAHTGTGNMTLTGLPVTSADNGMATPIMVLWSDITLAAVGNKLFAQVAVNGTTMDFYEVGSGGASAVAIDSAGIMRLSGFYFV